MNKYQKKLIKKFKVKGKGKLKDLPVSYNYGAHMWLCQIMLENITWIGGFQ